MMVLCGFDSNGARFADAFGCEHELGVADLVGLASEGRNPRSLQRSPGSLRPPGGLVACAAIAGHWQFRFADGALLTVSFAALADSVADRVAAYPAAVAVRRWDAASPPLPMHDYATIMADPAARLVCLRQVLSHGYVHVAQAPKVPGTVAQFLGSFGVVRETNYGTVFDVQVHPDPANLADSALALLPHTDNPYRQTPPDLQVLHTLVASASGGETWLVDGQAVVAHLRQMAPAALALLIQVPVRFAWQDQACHLAATEPIIELFADGTLRRIRANSRSLDGPIEPDATRRAQWWAAWHRLETCLADKAFAHTFVLGAGELVLMDNRRVLHGRTAFAGAVSGRHLQGAYADVDGLISQVHRLAQAQAKASVANLGALFAAPAMNDSYGEAMSIRDHMLRSAELAWARGLGEAGVAAALLHDIGWAQPKARAVPHEQAAAETLRAIFGPIVADPVAWHVEAKRYLVARDLSYRARLSSASLITLEQQGGPMSALECRQFEALPDHALYCALRKIDDDSKDIPITRSVWADYVPLLQRLALHHILNP